MQARGDRRRTPASCDEAAAPVAKWRRCGAKRCRHGAKHSRRGAKRRTRDTCGVASFQSVRCIAALLALSSFGCAHPVASSAAPAEPSQAARMEPLQSMIDQALADAARTTQREVSTLVVVSAGPVTWPDGSIGCPRPGMMYPQVLVPGYRIRIRAGGEVLDYHAGRSGAPFHCPAGRATEPAAVDPRI
jgi:hypothetical protein